MSARATAVKVPIMNLAPPGSALYTAGGGGEDPKKPGLGKSGREHEKEAVGRNHARNVAKKARIKAAKERRRRELAAQNQELDRELTESEPDPQ